MIFLYDFPTSYNRHSPGLEDVAALGSFIVFRYTLAHQNPLINDKEIVCVDLATNAYDK